MTGGSASHLGSVRASLSSSTLTFSGVQAAQTGSYSVVVSNAAGSVTSAVATLALIPIFPLEDALDGPGLAFTVGGSGNLWTGRPIITHDGVDAAQSGTVSDGSYNWMRTLVNGPGTLTFWWKVSSETNHDWLRFMVDGNDVVRISGEVDWQQVSYSVGAGTRELQWRYSKNSSLSAGQDRGWVDEVFFSTNGPPVVPPTVTPPSIQIQPVSLTLDEGQTAGFSVAAAGSAPLRYQWLFQGTNVVVDSGDLSGAATAGLSFSNTLLSWAGNYSVVISNGGGAITSAVARLTVNEILTLAKAVDALDLFFTTDGEAPWEGHKVVTHDGIDAARSGVVGDGGSSSLQTVVNGPGQFSFWWKVSSETNADVLAFLVNGHPEAFISGEVDWQQHSVSLLAGAQFLEWSYFKNGSLVAGDDRAWIDQVLFAPLSGFAPSAAPPTGAMTPRVFIVGDKVQLIWPARASRTYTVQFKESLAEGFWQSLDSEVLATWMVIDDAVQSDSYTATVEDFPGAQARFYRVLEY